jgi:hypothetical protein
MSLMISRQSKSVRWKYRFAYGLSEIFGIGIAIINRGDDLVHIAPNKDESPIPIEQIYSVKANRGRYIRDDVRYEPLPTVMD